jgi:hypothetical protein
MKTRVWENASRLTGRLLVVIALLLAGGTFAKATPTKTLVQDVLYRADGSVAHGNLTVRWSAFSTSAGEAVPAGEMTESTDANGNISIPLIPNVGATPAGGYYKVVVKLDDGTTSEENWVVPATATTTLAVIRAKVVPQSVAAQFVSRDYVDGQIAELAPVARSGSYSDLQNTPAIPNLAAPGTIGATTPGVVNATDLMPRNTPYADVRAYGGTCNGTVDDTVAFNLALASVANGGTVYAHNCKVNGSAVAWTNGTSNAHIKLLIDVALTLTSTLSIPSNVDVEGVSGGNSVQFAVGPVAEIIPPATGTAVLFNGKPNGNLTSSTMKNLDIVNPAGLGVDIEFGNFLTFDNVQVIVFPGNTTGAPLHIASGMHDYFTHCIFAQWNPNTPWSVHYSIDSPTGVDVPNSAQQEGSSIYFTNSTFVGYGVLLDNSVSVTGGSDGPFYFKDVRYQSGHGPFITVNTVHGGINGINVDGLDNEDGQGTWPDLYITPGTNYSVSNVNLWHVMGDWLRNAGEGSGSLINPDAPQVQGLYLDGENYPRGTAWSIAPQTMWQYSGGGKLDTDLQGLPMSPITLPYATQNVTFPNGGTCSAVTGPDGVAGSANRCTVVPYQIWATTSAAVGDWMIFGGWVKGDVGAESGDYQLWSAYGTGGATFDNGAPLGNVYASGGATQTTNTDGAWHFISRASKVTGIGSGNSVIVSPAGNGLNSPAYAYPFVVYVPASAGVPDAEVIRWQRHLLKGVIPSGAAAGAITGSYLTAASTATLTNKTFDTAGAGNVLKVNGTQLNATTGSGNTAVLAASPTFTGAPTVPYGDSTHPGIQIGGTGYGLSSYAGNQIDILVGGGTMAQFIGGAMTLYNGSYGATFQPTLTAARTYSFPDSSGNVVLDSTAQTLSNKTLASPTFSGSAPSLPGATFTSSPVTPQGTTTQPGLQVGLSGYGISNYAGNQIDIVTAGVLSAYFYPNFFALMNGAYGGQFTDATLTANQTYTLPNASGNVVLDSSSNTFTNKTFDTMGTGNAFKINGTAITTSVPIGDGGTGQTTQQAAINALTGAQSAGKYLRSDGTNATLAAIQAADVPTLNQNTTGSAASFTGALAGDVTGTQSATTVVKINGAAVPVSANALATNSSGQAVAGTSHNLSVPANCAAASASGTAYTCTSSPTFTPVAGDHIQFKADVANTGSATLAVNGATAATIKKWGGSGNLIANDLLAGHWISATFDGTYWQLEGQLGNSNAPTATSIAGGALGSIPYQSAAGTTAFLAGNTTTTPCVFTQTGTGSVSAAPTCTATPMVTSVKLLNSTYNATWATNTLTASYAFTTPNGASYSVMPATLTTTAAASDTVTVQGMTSTGHCSLTATNSTAAANHASTYVSAKTTNQITVAHTTTAGMTYDVLCTPN